MSSEPITQKEKMIVNTLTRIYSKEKLELELQEYLQKPNPIEIVVGIGKVLGLGLQGNLLKVLGIQYLNYAIENYEDIRKNIYPEHIDRCKSLSVHSTETEIIREIMYVVTRISTLNKFVDQVTDSIYEEGIFNFNADVMESEQESIRPESSEPTPENNEVGELWVTNVIE